MGKISAKDRIIFPLDVSTEDEARDLCALLKDDVGVFKIGLELYISLGPGIVGLVKKTAPKAKIFLDLKLHDIPETVKRATRAAVSLGVDFLTVHTGGGKNMLLAAMEESGGVKILGVTVLTSLGKEDLFEFDKKYQDPERLVLSRVETAKEAGLTGIVCSPLEVVRIREEFGQDLLTVTPGVRFADAKKKDDQKRVLTPFDAIRNGADYLVVGRPIRDAEDPIEAAKRVAREIESALAV